MAVTVLQVRVLRCVIGDAPTTTTPTTTWAFWKPNPFGGFSKRAHTHTHPNRGRGFLQTSSIPRVPSCSLVSDTCCTGADRSDPSLVSDTQVLTVLTLRCFRHVLHRCWPFRPFVGFRHTGADCSDPSLFLTRAAQVLTVPTLRWFPTHRCWLFWPFVVSDTCCTGADRSDPSLVSDTQVLTVPTLALNCSLADVCRKPQPCGKRQRKRQNLESYLTCTIGCFSWWVWRCVTSGRKSRIAFFRCLRFLPPSSPIFVDLGDLSVWNFEPRFDVLGFYPKTLSGFLLKPQRRSTHCPIPEKSTSIKWEQQSQLPLHMRTLCVPFSFLSVLEAKTTLWPWRFGTQQTSFQNEQEPTETNLFIE